MFDFLTGEALIALVALSAMEIVLGIDNLVFISILTSRLPEHQQKNARRLGLAGRGGEKGPAHKTAGDAPQRPPRARPELSPVR